MNNDESAEKQLSTRVNSARLSGYINKTVRLPCKVISVNGTQLLVEASDGGQVTVDVSATLQDGVVGAETYIEIIGKPEDSSRIQMHSCIGLGSNLDMKLVNDTIELIHDPRFYEKMFR